MKIPQTKAPATPRKFTVPALGQPHGVRVMNRPAHFASVTAADLATMPMGASEPFPGVRIQKYADRFEVEIAGAALGSFDAVSLARELMERGYYRAAGATLKFNWLGDAADWVEEKLTAGYKVVAGKAADVAAWIADHPAITGTALVTALASLGWVYRAEIGAGLAEEAEINRQHRKNGTGPYAPGGYMNPVNVRQTNTNINWGEGQTLAKFSEYTDKLVAALVAVDRGAVESLVMSATDPRGDALINLFQRKVLNGMPARAAAEAAVAEWGAMPSGYAERFWDPIRAISDLAGGAFDKVTSFIGDIDRRYGSFAAFVAIGGAGAAATALVAATGVPLLVATQLVSAAAAMGAVSSNEMEERALGYSDPTPPTKYAANTVRNAAMRREEREHAKKFREGKPEKFALQPGGMFVVVDVTPPGGRLANETIFTSAAAADAEADRLRAGGMNVQVIDALWYEPARARLVASGVIGR